MSIQKKLMITISSFTLLILVLNVFFSHINALAVNKAHLKQQINSIANQLTISLKLIEDTNAALELEMARTLYTSAKIAEQLLPKSYSDISNRELVELADRLNLSGITLWTIDENEELLSVRSSNPNEIELRSKTWDYWNTAMLEVYHMQPVTVNNGNTFPNFYSGPLNFSVTDASNIYKFGYYYCNNTNYMINTIIEAEQFYTEGYLEKKQTIVTQILEHVEGLDEITAINPAFFGKEKILKMKNGKLVYNLDVRDIIFGDYTYSNGEQDIEAVNKAILTMQSTSISFKQGDSHYTRVFIPIDATSPYIISFVFNQDALMEKTMDQLKDHISISIILFLLTLLATSILSQRLVAPVLHISEKVRQIAAQNFNFPLSVKSKDELGSLALNVNEMNDRLQSYTTELKVSAGQLAQAEHQLKSIIALTNDPIAMLTTEYKFYHVNKAFTQLFGYTIDDLADITLPALNQEQETNIKALLDDNVASGLASNMDIVLKNTKGQDKHINLALSPIHDLHEQCIGLAGIMHDMTTHHDKKLLQLQNEKLSAIGQLSATIAHEFRNPLTTLHGFLKLSEQRGQLSPQFIPMLVQEIENMELILGQFLTMAKPQAYMWHPVHIDELLSDIVHLLQSSGKLQHINVQWELSQSPISINGDQKFLRQAFVNLLKNSIEAIVDKGSISISIIKTFSFVTVTICDNGKGIKQEHLSKIFEPFFTSKEQGTGLGLLVTQQIIAAHHGEITYESELEKGTTVIIHFPVQ